MTLNTIGNNPSSSKQGIRWTHVLWIMLATMLLTAGVSYWAVRTYVYAKDFKPVVLKQDETAVLNNKLKQLGYSPESSQEEVRNNQPKPKNEFDSEGKLVPEAYSETGARREVTLTERELNALLANNTDLARKLAIDLSDNLMSAKLLVPVEQDFPILGGKTLRLSGGLEIAYENNKPIIILRGLSIMGIPLPNAWMGGMKNVDLVKEFGATEGFWKSLSDGIDTISVEDGYLKIRLKE